MTTQSLPISRTKKDYIQSGLAVFGLALLSVFSIYITNPKKIRSNATTTLVGIEFPNFQGIVMRQPRMTIVVLLAIVITISAFLFIGREALPFFSRPIAWASVVISALALLAVGYFNHDGKSGSWFRFFILCLAFTLGASLLTEIMVFYRRFFHAASWRRALWHKIIFALICGALTGAMAFSYYHFGLKNGAVLDYGVTTPTSEIPDIPSITDTTPLEGISGDTTPTDTSATVGTVAPEESTTAP